MRVCAAVANGLLTGDECGDLLGGLDVRLRKQVRIGTQDRFGPVAEPCGDDVQRNTVREGESCVGVAEDVQRPCGEAGGLPLALRLPDGDDAAEAEFGYQPQAGDEIRIDGNRLVVSGR